MGPYGLKYPQMVEGIQITGFISLFCARFPTQSLSALPTPLHMPLHSNICIAYSANFLVVPPRAL